MERHARMPLLNVSYHVFAVGFYFTGNLRQFFCTISRVMRWHEQMILSEYKSLSYMENCVFCKIASGEFDSARVWEDGEFLAILDLNPNVKGMTLVMTKKHYDSYAFGMPDDVYVRLMSACKKVGKLLDEKLGTVRTAMVMEGKGVFRRLSGIHFDSVGAEGGTERVEETGGRNQGIVFRFSRVRPSQFFP